MSDTISRAKAIDGKICIRRSNGVEIYDDYVVPVEYLEQLPPAQPSTGDCWGCNCPKMERLAQPEPSQVAKDIARIVENGQDMRVIGQPERIKGHWIKISPANIYECSECGKSVMTNDICAYDFCHGCGAEMIER